MFQFPSTQSVSALLNNLHASKKAPYVYNSGIQRLDSILDGGLKRGQCLEISGPPGSGRNSIALDFVRKFIKSNEDGDVLVVGESIAASSESLGNNGGRITIDCQNLLARARITRQLLEEKEEILKNAGTKTPEQAEKRIHHVTINGFAELFSFLNQLPKYLVSNPLVSLSFV